MIYWKKWNSQQLLHQSPGGKAEARRSVLFLVSCICAGNVIKFILLDCWRITKSSYVKNSFLKFDPLACLTNLIIKTKIL